MPKGLNNIIQIINYKNINSIMKKIGLTGGIGSGKTFIAGIFQKIGIPVYNSDFHAKRLMTSNKELVKEITQLFGKSAYDKDGALNKNHLSSLIFSDATKLEALNSLVHPAVRKDFEHWAAKQKKCSYVINEAALFVENGSHSSFDALITVLSPMALRIKRVMERDQKSKKEIMARINNQSSDEEKIKVSRFLIYNDNSDMLLQQISKINQSILQM